MICIEQSNCFFKSGFPNVPCSNELVNFSDLLVRSPETPLDCRSELEHLLFLTGYFDLLPQNMKEYSVCSSHLCAIRAPQRKDHCDLCKDIFFKKKCAISSLQRVTRSLAIVICTTRKINKYNCWMCRPCRNALSQEIDESTVNIVSFFDWLYDELIVFTPSSTTTPSVSTSEYLPTQTSLNQSQPFRNHRDFKEWLVDTGFTGRCETTLDYCSLGQHSQTNFINQTKNILYFIVQQELAPNNSETVWKELIEREIWQATTNRLGSDYQVVMRALTDAYSNATHWSTKRQILSIVAADLPGPLLQMHFPDLTDWKIRVARNNAYFQGRGVLPESLTTSIERFSHEQISHFIDFILSPHITTDLPFGETKIRLSTGETLLVSDVIRNQIPSRIIAQYLSFCEEQSTDNFRPLSSTSLFSILNHCAASTRKSLSGIDYFSADGSTAFDELRQLVMN